MGDFVKHYRELDVYKMAMEGAMEIFTITKSFPDEEKFGITNQIRRSSRSVCANIGEAWRKRRYRAAFVSKLNDSETEAAETQVWLEISHKCKYLDESTFKRLDLHYDRITGKLVRMIENPDQWLVKQ
ncbi:MAG: four helix bundle protein [Candidatus Cloacimonas sp. 4484_209]|nr:MAG: four helix bundle protein [Candidatus Cloacimonas sp. 4484_209]